MKLFVRLHRALRLAPAGARYLPAVREAFDALDAATRALVPRRGAAALRVSVLPSFAASWLVPRLGDFRAKHPRVDLALHSSPELADLARDPVDVAIRCGRGEYPGLHVELLPRDEIAPVASPRRALARPEDLRRHTLLHDGSHAGWRDWLAAAGLRGAPAERGLVRGLGAARAGGGRRARRCAGAPSPRGSGPACRPPRAALRAHGAGSVRLLRRVSAEPRRGAGDPGVPGLAPRAGGRQGPAQGPLRSRIPLTKPFIAQRRRPTMVQC